MRQRGIKSILLLTVFVVCGLLGVPTAFAAENPDSLTAEIPVSCVGAPCTAQLSDASGRVLDSLSLTPGVTAKFTVNCQGLNAHVFNLKLTDTDTAAIAYDKTEFAVTVELFRIAEDKVIYTITADPTGVLDPDDAGKPDKLEFVNTEIPPPTVPPTEPPVEPLCTDDPPVTKQVKGNAPYDVVFTFTLTAKSDDCPMPEGSFNGKKELRIIGPGEGEFGLITFTQPGTYEYTVTEKNNHSRGYVYDESVYTIRYEITEVDGQLVMERTFLKNGGIVEDINSAVFVNEYTGKSRPKTGDDRNLGLWLGVGGGSLCVLLAVVFFLLRKKKK